jgi:hypothetical protein
MNIKDSNFPFSSIHARSNKILNKYHYHRPTRSQINWHLLLCLNFLVGETPFYL